eukprot:7780461-Alexandrium_andersonii.AAC.1
MNDDRRWGVREAGSGSVDACASSSLEKPGFRIGAKNCVNLKQPWRSNHVAKGASRMSSLRSL